MTNLSLPFHRLGAILLLLMACFGVAQAQTIEVPRGQSVERIDQQATYFLAPEGEHFDAADANAAFEAGRFSGAFPETKGRDQNAQSLWIGLRLKSGEAAQGQPIRRVIGLGAIFVVLPHVYLIGEDGSAQEILATRSGDGNVLAPRYFTYARTQSFTLEPGEPRTVLINVTVTDRPTLGVFREGELGHNQIVATLIKSGFALALLFIAVVTAIIAFLTKRPIGTIFAIGFGLVMLHVDASLYTTVFGGTRATGRVIWEVLTLSVIFYCFYAFLFVFRDSLRLTRYPLLAAFALALPLPLIWLAWTSDETTDILWAYYLALFLFACIVGLRFDIAPRLRAIAAGIMFACVFAALAIEPYYLGRNLPDLTIEYLRDAIRMMAGLGALFLLLVDVLRTREERDRLTAERIAALEAQTETDRRLLETEREYARARESALRRQRQLAAASHDIRQPLIGLRSALAEEADNLSLGLQGRLTDAIDYLEDLTREYSDREPGAPAAAGDEEEYSLDLVLRAVSDMFAGEAASRGIELRVASTTCRTRVPALALMRATSNLVANALRHAGADRILVGVRHREGGCVIEVLDNGCGMDAATLAEVREPGRKREGSDGDGLGLAIVHELAERHSIDFTMESAPNEGTAARLFLSTS
ncbi:MAG: HAMP domain-containing sensor histidine kinase [Sphingomonadaceae bacterium]